MALEPVTPSLIIFLNTSLLTCFSLALCGLCQDNVPVENIYSHPFDIGLRYLGFCCAGVAA